MFTGRFCEHTVTMKLVWRHRNAGVCSTSTTAATSFERRVFMHVGEHGQAELPLHFGQDAQALFDARAAKALQRDERFALSNDDLKMNGILSRVVSSLSWPAVSRIKPSLSTTHGPAIRKNGLSGPTVEIQ